MDACRGGEAKKCSLLSIYFTMMCSIQHLELLYAVYNAGLIPYCVFEVKMKKLT
jgi:hypothetical protein